MNDIQEAITALVKAKADIPQSDLVQWAPAQFDAKYREWYYEASRQGIVVQINLAIRALGVETTAGQFHWEYVNPATPTITARHDAQAGTTIITVGAITVLKNDVPGCEVFNPGTGAWLDTLGSAYAAKLQEQQHAAAKAREAAQTNKAADFLKQV